MEDPAKGEDYIHLCPHCRKPVPPGFKFCEVCGAKITSMLTCSKCGTQFVHPKKYCDCCGARFVPKEILDAEGAAGEPAEEDAVQPAAGEATGAEDAEPAEEEPAPEEYEEEVSEPEFEGEPEPAEDPVPDRKKAGIAVPDTQELLEKYGKDYDDEDTIDSARRVKKLGRNERGIQKTGTGALVPAERERRPARRSAGSTRMIAGGGIALIAILAAVYFIGLPLFAGTGGPGAGPAPTPGPAVTVTPETPPVIIPDPAPGALVTRPTETVPDQKYYFSVKKNPVTYRITVIFIGSASPGTITGADVKVTRSDGLIGTGTILPLKGVSEIFLNGSDGADRVEITAKMASGKTYRVYDALVSPMT